MTEAEAELPLGVGERLRAAREAKGLSLAQVAAETRITQRHLEQIERGDFSELPGRTYAIGFARNFAKAVGLDQEQVAGEVREELAEQAPFAAREASSFEPGDPARVPSSRLAWYSAAAALVLFVGGGLFFWRSYLAPAVPLPALLGGEAATRPSAPASPAPQPAATRAAVDPAGAVVFTAQADGIWVKFYDRFGRQLMQKQMALGESYTVPPDADGPQLWTGRPDALKITIGGKEIPRLSQEDQVMRDVPVTAEALLARQPEPDATPSPTA